MTTTLIYKVSHVSEILITARLYEEFMLLYAWSSLFCLEEEKIEMSNYWDVQHQPKTKVWLKLWFFI